jgi:hypothetical protein
MTNYNEISRREYLLDRLRDGSIERNDALELKNILEKEKTEAIHVGDIAVIFGIAILLGLVIEQLSKKKKFSLRNILGFGS